MEAWLTDGSFLDALGLAGEEGAAPSGRDLDEVYAGGQPATTYFGVHRQKIMAAIEARLAGARPPAPHARLSWRADAAAIASAVHTAWLDACGGAFGLADKLPALLYPADPWRVIDQYRDLFGGAPGVRDGGQLPEGRMEWNPGVGAALALEVEAQLRASLPRMGLRYVAQVEAGGGQVTVGMLVTSHPFDRITARLLCTPGLLKVEQRKEGTPGSRDTSSRAAFRDGLRMVVLEWQGARDPKLWNWVRAVEPADARKEEVAAQLYLGEDELRPELAYALTGAPPFFQVPRAWALQMPEARAHAPADDVAVAQAAGKGIDEITKSEQASAVALADSALADELAAQQAAGRGLNDDRLRSLSGYYNLRAAYDDSERVLLQISQPMGAWKLFGQLGPALRWVVRRREALMNATDPAPDRWAPVVAGQSALLAMAQAEIAEVLRVGHELAGDPLGDAARPVRETLLAYAIACGESHLVATAGGQMSVARRLKTELPLRLVEQTLADSRAATRDAVDASAQKPQSAKPAVPLASGDRTNSAEGKAGAPAEDPRIASQQTMENQALALREALGGGRPMDPATLSQLALAAAEQAHRQRISALDARAAALEAQASAATEGALNTYANLFTSSVHELPDKLRRVRRRARRSVVEMDERTHAWIEAQAVDASQIRDEAGSQRYAEELRAERHKNLTSARNELAAIAAEEELGELFQSAHDELRAAALRVLIVEVALLIGVSVVGMGVGAAHQAADRGAILANAAIDSLAFARTATVARGVGTLTNLAAEAGVNAAAQTMLDDSQSGGRNFASSFVSSVAVLGALRPLQQATRSWDELEAGVQGLWKLAAHGKRVARLGSAATLEVVGAAAISEVIEAALPGGRAAAGDDDSLPLYLQGASMGAGRFLSGRVAKLLQRLEHLGSRSAALRLRAIDHDARVRLAAKSGDADAMKVLFVEHETLLLAERDLLEVQAGVDRGTGNAAVPIAEMPGKLAAHAEAGARVHTLERDAETGRRRYSVEYPDGRRLQLDEAASTARPGADGKAPTSEQAAEARAAADRAAEVQERRDQQLTALIQGSAQPIAAETVIIGAGQGGTLSFAHLQKGNGAAQGVAITAVPEVFNIAPERSMFSRHGELRIGQKPSDHQGPPGAEAIRRPGELSSNHDEPSLASDYVRSLELTGYEHGMVTYRAEVTRVEARPAEGWGEGVPPAMAALPVRVVAGGKTIYVKQLISSTGLGAPRKVGFSGTPLAAHEAELAAAGKLVYAQEKLSVPGAKHVVVIGDGATGAWACEASVRDGAEKVIWVGGRAQEGPIPSVARAELEALGLTELQIRTFWRSYNTRNAPIFKHIQSGKIELRSGFADATLDPSSKFVTASFSDGAKVETDVIVVAVGQQMTEIPGMERMRFQMVFGPVSEGSRMVGLEAVSAEDGRPLGIRVQGAQMASPGIGDRVVETEQRLYKKYLTDQSSASSVPTDSLGVPGSVYQSNLDIN